MFAHFSALVRQRPLVTFVALAYALSWWPWLLMAFGRSAQPVAGYGPFVATLVVLGVGGGWPAVRGLLAAMVRWRVGPGWWVAALLGPAALAAVAAIIAVGLGATPPTAVELAGWPNILPMLVLFLVVPGIGGAWEEPGWRGYALPRIEAGRTPLAADLRLWVVVAGWHLPLLLSGFMAWHDLVAMLGGVAVYNWVYRGTGGSVLLVMATHAANNAISGEFLSPLFRGADADLLALARAAIWCTAGLAVVVEARYRRSVRPAVTVAATSTLT
jgi:membrane protease YdiL (CAAX protease family)